MQIVVNYIQGIEPTQADPQLAAVDRYLNIPWLKYYAEPLYTNLRRPFGVKLVNLTYPQKEELDWTNISVFIQAVEQKRPLVIEYLRQKGFDFGGAFLYAVCNRSDDVEQTAMRSILAPYKLDEPILVAICDDEFSEVERIIAARPEIVEAVAIAAAYYDESITLRSILAASPTLSPSARDEISRAVSAYSSLHPHNIDSLRLSAEYLYWLSTNHYVRML